MGHFLITLALVGGFALHRGEAYGGSGHFDQFKAALERGDHAAALKVFTSDPAFRSGWYVGPPAYDQVQDSYPDTWSTFQQCFHYSTRVGAYGTSAAMMAFSAAVVEAEEYAAIRTAVLDFLLNTFTAFIPYDTLMTAPETARHLVRFITSYVQAKDGPYTEEQALFVLLYPDQAEAILDEPVEGRCALFGRVAAHLHEFGPAGDAYRVAAMLRAACKGTVEELVQKARAVIDTDRGGLFFEARKYAYTLLWANDPASRTRGNCEAFIELAAAHNGACSPRTVNAVDQALFWFGEGHGAYELKQFSDELLARHHREEYGNLVGWLPVFQRVRGRLTLSGEVALAAIVDANMKQLLKGLEGAKLTFDQVEALVYWKTGAWTTWQEAEANGREALALLSAVHSGEEENWLNAAAPLVRWRYRACLSVTYLLLCEVFGEPSHLRVDSLCRYAGLLQQQLLLEPALASDYEGSVNEQLEKCAAAGASSSQFTRLFTEEELLALDQGSFIAYVEWYGQVMEEAVRSVTQHWVELDPELMGEGLARDLQPIEEHYLGMLALAKARYSLSTYHRLLDQWVQWTPSTSRKDHLLSVLGSIQERYPELGTVFENSYSVNHSSTDLAIIIQDRYQKHQGTVHRTQELIMLANIVLFAELWGTLQDPGRSVLCEEVLGTLSNTVVENEVVARDWLRTARSAMPLILGHGSDGNVHEMLELLHSRWKIIQPLTRVERGSFEEREHQLAMGLLKARSLPKKFLPSAERSLLELMEQATDPIRLEALSTHLCSYAAVLEHNPEVAGHSATLIPGLDLLSRMVYGQFMLDPEQRMTRIVQSGLNRFWKLYRVSVRGRGPSPPSPLLMTACTRMLGIQARSIPLDDAASILQVLGFDEALFETLKTRYWASPASVREHDEEWTGLAATYDLLFAVNALSRDPSPCPMRASIERYWERVQQAGPVSARTLQTREALSRYEKLACRSGRSWVILDNDLDTWLRFPLPTAILEFQRDEQADLYRLRYRSEGAENNHVLGTIEHIEASWRSWATARSGEGSSDGKEVPAFWEGVIAATGSDTTIRQYVLVPDGIYFNVNPTLLPIERTGQARVDVVVDLDRYLRPLVPTNRVGSMVLVGGLDYGGTRSKGFGVAALLRSDEGLDEDGSWVDLPGTEREVKGIAEKLQGKRVAVDLITGSEATNTRVGELAFPQAIHFATHGFVDRRVEGGRSGGLVLSQANTRGASATEGGGEAYLYTKDIRELDLFACDLVVLSACRTALSSDGLGQGEIIKAFKDAGVSKVIASSWAVPDECTSLLMGYFYDHYLQGIPASQALAEAQRKVAMRFPEDKDWAAFMVYH